MSKIKVEEKPLEFESESESEEEEEILVYANIKSADPKALFKSNSRPFFRAVGMDTDTPFVQINEFIFKGEYADCMGTNLFFEESSGVSNSDPIFEEEVKNPLHYVCKTNKILKLDRVFLKPKEEGAESADLPVENVESNLDTEPRSSSVEEAVQEFSDYFKKHQSNMSMEKK